VSVITTIPAGAAQRMSSRMAGTSRAGRDPDPGHAAGAGDVVGSAAGQEQHEFGDFSGLGEPAGGHLAGGLPGHVFVVGACRCADGLRDSLGAEPQVGGDGAGADGVDADAVRAGFLGESLAERQPGRLWRCCSPGRPLGQPGIDRPGDGRVRGLANAFVHILARRRARILGPATAIRRRPDDAIDGAASRMSADGLTITPMFMSSSGSPGSWPSWATDVRYPTSTYVGTEKLASLFRNLITCERGELDLPDHPRAGSAACRR
jgi:hypothetical protein